MSGPPSRTFEGSMCKGTIKLEGFEVLPFKLPDSYSAFTFLHNSNLLKVLLEVLNGVGYAIVTS